VGFKVILSPQAIALLEGIARDIARAAERFGMWLIDQAPLLGDFPELGSPHRKRPGVRRWLGKPCFIHYRIKEREQVVAVLDCWHSARQGPELL
jgi:plasmid stabilization system protein ParE